MALYVDMTADELKSEYAALQREYDKILAKKYNIVMARGVQSEAQLDLSSPMMTCVSENDYTSEDGTDCRNYGGLDGISEMKKIVADILRVEPDEVIVGGNSSLAMMFDNISVNVSHGVRDGLPWQRQGEVKFICPVPGYDRHFSICDYFHIKMINVGMRSDGPDMDAVEALVESDPMIKGMWCIPVYSNPDGCVYSNETVRRIARLSPAASDFRLYWDNAYCIHNFRGTPPAIPDILRECAEAGNENMPLEFMSFSKISFCGAAVSAIAASRSNCDYIRKRLSVQSIGPDKLNQLRHARFFKDADGVARHMKKMAEILRPKFELVTEIFTKNIGPSGAAVWSDPDGGYFISVSALPGCAKRAVKLCGDAGVKLTPAGAAFPYGVDPLDSNIRIAPSFPILSELETAAGVFCVAVKIAAVEKLLETKSVL